MIYVTGEDRAFKMSEHLVLRKLWSAPKVDMPLHMCSRKVEMCRLETDLIKLFIYVQLGDNLRNGTLHITWN